ncbi:hypothetical protein GobsT_12940 [Gemmata obscuriglobus]|nr:hypothetical protein GobsT_12940 [Gemmata obscuriglobus]VTS01946.1 unnamed protein product [Gemmata obscuriglobus UQM 2246]
MPAEVVAEVAERGGGPVRVPVLGEPVTLANLAATAVPVGPVVPLHEARVHHGAHGRGRQPGGPGPEHHPRAHPHHPIVLLLLVDGGVRHRRWDHRVWVPRATRATGPRRDDHVPVGVPDGLLVHGVLVGCHQPHHPPPGPPAEVPDQRVGRVGGPLAHHHAHHQSALRVQSHVVPTVPPSGVLGVATLLLLADEGPLLVERDLMGLGGKKRLTRRAVGSRGRRSVGCTK